MKAKKIPTILVRCLLLIAAWPVSAFAEEVIVADKPAEIVLGTTSTRQTAVECATAELVEQASQQHKLVGNVVTSVYSAGVCTGKMQTFMLIAQRENPNCFPKISLEDGISIFVKWADAHPAQYNTGYISGFSEAFAEMAPCLKNTDPKN